MSLDADAVRNAAKGRQRFDKPQPAETPPTPEPVSDSKPTNGAHESAHEPRSTKPRKRKSTTAKRKPSTPPPAVDEADIEQRIAERRAEAEALAAEVEAEVPEPKPKISKADRERIRRAGRRVATVELDPQEGVLLDALAARFGSQRAAIGEALRRLYAEIEAGSNSL